MFTNLITVFSNITVAQAESLIGVVQSAPGVPANAFVNLLISFTQDTQAVTATTTGTQPTTTACPTGYSGVYPNCIAPQCPQYYTGTYPNCIALICPSGTTGIYPNCQTISISNSSVCPSGYSGTYPNCSAPQCPSGYTGSYPICVAPTPQCPSGETGTYPNCVVPSCTSLGKVGTYPNCTTAPQLKIVLTSDKTQIGANGQDTATITMKVTNADGTPVRNTTVLETSPTTQTLTTDASGTATFTVTTNQAGTLNVGVTVNGQNYGTSINAMSTTGNVSGSADFSGPVRAPASDQILATFIPSNIDTSISSLKLVSMKLKLVNLDQTWFQNVRITNSPPCTQGRFCTVQTIAGPASYTLGQDGILTITPNTPVDVYAGKAIYIIADMLDTPSFAQGTDYPILTYQISIPDVSSIGLTGTVNGYSVSTVNLNLTSGLTPVTTTISSNTCNSNGVAAACY